METQPLLHPLPEGGWTVIQKRHDGSQNFNQLWESYKKGFGNLNGRCKPEECDYPHHTRNQKRKLTFLCLFLCPPGEFWLGLENIHSLAKQGQYLLQVELTDGAGQQQPAATYRFQLDGEDEKFALHLESASGTQEEIMSTGASGLPFSTADRDNDLAADVNCAELLSGVNRPPLTFNTLQTKPPPDFS